MTFQVTSLQKSMNSLKYQEEIPKKITFTIKDNILHFFFKRPYKKKLIACRFSHLYETKRISVVFKSSFSAYANCVSSLIQNTLI